MNYRLRHHPRARRVKLRVERDGAVVVTAPGRLRRAEIDRFVKAQEAWIAQMRERLASQRERRDPATCSLRPTRIDLPALAEQWQVVYGLDDAGRVDDSARDSVRTVCLPDDEPDEHVARRLQAWLKRRARASLTPRVEALAARHGLTPGRISFRNQKTRWGSCSSSGNLSLNARLLLCSPEACRYVLIHELVHLEHPNHSPAFWRRVGELCPDYRERIPELRVVSNRLPDWVTAS